MPGPIPVGTEVTFDEPRIEAVLCNTERKGLDTCIKALPNHGQTRFMENDVSPIVNARDAAGMATRLATGDKRPILPWKVVIIGISAAVMTDETSKEFSTYEEALSNSRSLFRARWNHADAASPAMAT